MRLVLGLIAWLGLAASLQAATVTLAWDPPAGAVAGYRIRYGTAAGQWPLTQDVGNVTTATVPSLTPGMAYWFVVVAYDAAGQVSGPSNEVMTAIATTDPCAFPLGATAVQIFPTGKLNKTGSGGAGSKAFINFQAASPNSPVVYVAIRANGSDIPDSITQGTNLHALGSLWFTIPPGPATYAFSIYARNAAACARDQATGFSVTLP